MTPEDCQIGHAAGTSPPAPPVHADLSFTRLLHGARRRMTACSGWLPRCATVRRRPCSRLHRWLHWLLQTPVCAGLLTFVSARPQPTVLQTVTAPARPWPPTCRDGARPIRQFRSIPRISRVRSAANRTCRLPQSGIPMPSRWFYQTVGVLSPACWVSTLLWLLCSYVLLAISEHASCRRQGRGAVMSKGRMSNILCPAASILSAFAVSIAAALG